VPGMPTLQSLTTRLTAYGFAALSRLSSKLGIMARRAPARTDGGDDLEAMLSSVLSTRWGAVENVSTSALTDVSVGSPRAPDTDIA